MAIAIDPSSPASVVGNAATTLTTASFNPPAGSLLVAVTSGDVDSGNVTATVSDNQANTWTRHVRSNTGGGGGGVDVWACYLASSAAGLTVSAVFANAWNSANTGLLTVGVLTGAASTQPGATATSNTSTVSVTPTALGSLVIGGMVSVTNSATPSANANSTVAQGVNGGGGAFTLASWYASSLTSSLSATTYGLSNGSGSRNSAGVEFLVAEDPDPPAADTESAWLTA